MPAEFREGSRKALGRRWRLSWPRSLGRGRRCVCISWNVDEPGTSSPVALESPPGQGGQ